MQTWRLTRSIKPLLKLMSSEEDATAHLDLMNKASSDARKNPWTLSFSYGRALQTSCLKAWLGNESNVAAAQAALLRVSEANSKASLGQC